MYRRFCQHRSEVSYLSVDTEETKDTEQTESSEVVQIEQPQVQDFYSLSTSLAILSTILAYFYLCDRYIYNYIMDLSRLNFKTVLFVFFFILYSEQISS